MGESNEHSESSYSINLNILIAFSGVLILFVASTIFHPVIGSIADKVFSNNEKPINDSYNISNAKTNGFRNLIETQGRSIGRKGYSLFYERPENYEGLLNASRGTELLRPDFDREGYWVGSASPYYDNRSDTVYIYYRLRDPYNRGFKTVISRFDQGELQKVNEFRAKEFDAHSLEGGALTSKNGSYVLYVSYQDKRSGDWKVDSISADSIKELDAENRQSTRINSEKTHFKDPVIDDGELVVHVASKNFFRLSNLKVKSLDQGLSPEELKFHENLSGGRITSSLKLDGEKFYFYDWKPSVIFTGEERSKIGVLKDGKIEGLMQNKALGTNQGTGSLRYVKPIKIDDEVWFFYEGSLEGKGHALYLEKIPVEKVSDVLENL